MVWNFGWFMNVRPRIFISDILDGSDRHNIYLELFLIILECPACLRTSFSLWFKPLSQSNLSFFYLFSLSLSLSLSLSFSHLWRLKNLWNAHEYVCLSACLAAYRLIVQDNWFSKKNEKAASAREGNTENKQITSSKIKKTYSVII